MSLKVFRVRCCSAAVILVATFVSPTVGQPRGGGAKQTVGDPRALELLRVPTSTGVAWFYVGEAEAPISAAWRDDVRPADKPGHASKPSPGFEVTNQVIVRVDRREELARLVAERGELVVEPVAGVPGYWKLGVGSVREAVELAESLAARGGFGEVFVDLKRPWALRTVPSDPYFSQQWHLKNDLDPLFDVNAEAAWDAGYTGAGVVIGIVEGAWQHDHVDLAGNFHAAASQEGGSVTPHATSCAGIAAAVGNNEVMGVGVAYGAWLSGQIYGTDAEVAEALAYRNDLNDIKSNSWGPPDYGQVYYMPSVVRSAIEESIAVGRDGLGEVFVWAGGNGGTSNDRVDYDPYASSRFTIAVGAIGDADAHPYYSEKGSSLMVVTQSSGNDRDICTTTAPNSWTIHFGGTSAASPLAAGVAALMLEANPGLTWRDVQHVLIDSARKCDPNAEHWVTNGGGYEVNYSYGFGAIDAGAAVELAESWVNVPHELVVDTGVVAVNTPIPDNDPNGVLVTASIADNIRIESVELIVNAETTYVGDLRIAFTSPSGTTSVVAKQRVGDGKHNYVDYLFTSLRHWGEVSAGDWTVEIADLAAGNLASWTDYRLIIYGTPVCPGDLDEDGEISMWDLLELLAVYGTREGDEAFDPAADLFNNGRIDLSDLAQLLSIYGESCE